MARKIARKYSVVAVRSALGMTSEKFAQLMHVSHDCMRAWECGRRRPSMFHQAAIDRMGMILDNSKYIQRNQDTFSRDLAMHVNIEDFLSYIFTVDINRP